MTPEVGPPGTLFVVGIGVGSEAGLMTRLRSSLLSTDQRSHMTMYVRHSAGGLDRMNVSENNDDGKKYGGKIYL